MLLGGLDDAELDAGARRAAALHRRDDHPDGRSCASELDRVREQGYAVAVDELEVGLTAVAAPIRNAHGDVVASMSVSGPTFRLAPERVDEVVPLLVEAAAGGLAPPRLGSAMTVTGYALHAA